MVWGLLTLEILSLLLFPLFLWGVMALLLALSVWEAMAPSPELGQRAAQGGPLQAGRAPGGEVSHVTREGNCTC